MGCRELKTFVALAEGPSDVCSQYLLGGSQSLIIPLPGDFTYCSGLVGTVNLWYTYIYADKILIHIKLKKRALEII